MRPHPQSSTTLLCGDDAWCIACEARFLWERAVMPSPIAPAGAGCPPSEAAQRLLQRWGETCAGGDAAAFERRLLWSGLNRASALRLLADPGPPGRALPTWIHTLRSALDAAQRPGRAAQRGHTWWPFLAVARERLQARGVQGAQWMSDDAIASLELALMRPTWAPGW